MSAQHHKTKRRWLRSRLGSRATEARRIVPSCINPIIVGLLPSNSIPPIARSCSARAGHALWAPMIFGHDYDLHDGHPLQIAHHGMHANVKILQPVYWTL